MTDRDVVRTKLIALIQPFVRREGDIPIDDKTLLESDLNVNSARMIDLVLEIEDTFQISIEDESIDRLVSVGEAVDLIMEKMLVEVETQ
jgi:acyl carrier protein